MKGLNEFAAVYEDNLQKHYYFFYFVFEVTIVFDILFCIPYFLFRIYFCIFLLVFSFSFKNYPLKYFIGIVYGNIS